MLKHFLMLSILTLVLAGMAPSSSQAQFNRGNPYVRNPGGLPANRGARVTSVPNRGGYTPRAPVAGYGVPYGGYGYGYPYAIENPYSGYLNGVSNVIGAQGQYAQDYTQARITNQQAEQEKIKTRRMLYDQRRYEQMMKPTLNQIREKQQYEALRRALNNPPLTEVLNASALNTLYNSLKKHHASGQYGPEVPLDPYTMQNINVSASTGGNAGVFRNGGKLEWPFPLKDSAFERERQQMDMLSARAAMEAQSGSIQSATIADMRETVRQLDSKVRGLVQNMPLGEYMTAKRYVDELEAGVKALQAPGSTNYFNGKWTAQGRNVGELVARMAQEGLTFAPASRGDETAYRSLHQSMVTYELAIGQQVAKAGAPKK